MTIVSRFNTLASSRSDSDSMDVFVQRLRCRPLASPRMQESGVCVPTGTWRRTMLAAVSGR